MKINKLQKSVTSNNLFLNSNPYIKLQYSYLYILFFFFFIYICYLLDIRAL